MFTETLPELWDKEAYKNKKREEYIAESEQGYVGTMPPDVSRTCDPYTDTVEVHHPRTGTITTHYVDNLEDQRIRLMGDPSYSRWQSSCLTERLAPDATEAQKKEFEKQHADHERRVNNRLWRFGRSK